MLTLSLCPRIDFGFAFASFVAPKQSVLRSASLALSWHHIGKEAESDHMVKREAWAI